MISIIEGDIKDAKYVSKEILFTNLDYLTDGIFISNNPNIYYGVRLKQLNRRVRNKLNSRIISLT
jgi:hypothetical protein